MDKELLYKKGGSVMKKKTKIWLVLATSLVTIGLIMFTAVMFKLEWNFLKLSTVEYETNTYDISEEFSNILIETDTADITFKLSDDGRCIVECYEEETSKHVVTAKDDTLLVKLDDRLWEFINIDFGSPKITVYLPKTEYNSLSVSEHTGDIFVKDISVETLNLSTTTGRITVSDVICGGDIGVGVSTGRTYLSNISCKNLITSGNTGDISLENVIAEEKFRINRSTGDVLFENSDANEIFVETDTGDVSGSILTEKVFIIQTDTGEVKVPKTLGVGKCEISTNTGDIELEIR